MAQNSVTKQQRQFERELRLRGVRKPYVTIESGRVIIESYPLTVFVTQHHCTEMGPYQYLKLNDCGKARLGEDATIETHRVYMGQCLVSHVAQLILDFFPQAYERAHKQDGAALGGVA